MNKKYKDNPLVGIDLSVIVVNWNTRALLVSCLNTVYQEILALRSQNIHVETLVVDNASHDDSVAVVREQFPWVTLLENTQNLGFPGANNQAIRICQGRYVLLLNSDTEVYPGAFNTLMRFLDENVEVGAVGARLLNADGSLQESCYPMPTLLRELWRMFHLDAFYSYGVYKMADWDLNRQRQVDVLLGACILLRREVLDVVGLMDEGYFMYSEEVDLCYRVKKHGWSIYWVPSARIMHYGGQSTRQVGPEMFLRLYQSKLMFMRKHYGRVAGWTYKIILYLATIFRLVLAPFAYFQSPDKRRKNLDIANNYQRFLFALARM